MDSRGRQHLQHILGMQPDSPTQASSPAVDGNNSSRLQQTLGVGVVPTDPAPHRRDASSVRQAGDRFIHAATVSEDIVLALISHLIELCAISQGHLIESGVGSAKNCKTGNISVEAVLLYICSLLTPLCAHCYWRAARMVLYHLKFWLAVSGDTPQSDNAFISSTDLRAKRAGMSVEEEEKGGRWREVEDEEEEEHCGGVSARYRSQLQGLLSSHTSDSRRKQLYVLVCGFFPGSAGEYAAAVAKASSSTALRSATAASAADKPTTGVDDIADGGTGRGRDSAVTAAGGAVAALTEKFPSWSLDMNTLAKLRLISPIEFAVRDGQTEFITKFTGWLARTGLCSCLYECACRCVSEPY